MPWNWRSVLGDENCGVEKIKSFEIVQVLSKFTNLCQKSEKRYVFSSVYLRKKNARAASPGGTPPGPKKMIFFAAKRQNIYGFEKIGFLNELAKKKGRKFTFFFEERVNCFKKSVIVP